VTASRSGLGDSSLQAQEAPLPSAYGSRRMMLLLLLLLPQAPPSSRARPVPPHSTCTPTWAMTRWGQAQEAGLASVLGSALHSSCHEQHLIEEAVYPLAPACPDPLLDACLSLSHRGLLPVQGCSMPITSCPAAFTAQLQASATGSTASTSTTTSHGLLESPFAPEGHGPSPVTRTFPLVAPARRLLADADPTADQKV
jgi:hypothetical protein